MNCEKHPEVAATLAVDLPSIGVKRYLCEPCKAALVANFTPYKGKREAWDNATYDWHISGGITYFRMSEGWRSTDNEQPKGLYK